MRKWLIWILFVLLPLKLWAGALMPMPTSAASHNQHAALVKIACPHEAQDTCQLNAIAHSPPSHHDHADHEHQAQHNQDAKQTLNSAQAHHEGMTMGSGICSDGPGCLTCSACHMSAGLPVNAERFTSHAALAAPATPLATWLGLAWPPLIKPPIS